MHHPHQHFHPTRPPALGRRYAVLGVGLLIMAFGIAFSIQGVLGTSPISSLPYVVSLLIPLTVGEATICLHVVLILLQILILRRNYDPIQLMQLPVAVVFGYLTDLGVWVVQGLPVPNYGVQWLYCLIGVVLVAVGVALEVIAGVVTLAGEGFILAVCQVTAIPFGNMKVGFDLTLVAIVSEETGAISTVVNGNLRRHLSPETLGRLLRNELLPREETNQSKRKHPLLFWKGRGAKP